jgi:hypothetical protein
MRATSTRPDGVKSGKTARFGARFWSWALESVVRKLSMQTCKAQVASRERMSELVAKEFEGETLTLEQKAKVARRWDKILKEKDVYQLLLDLMEK